jgi:nucleotide-binding universal stress UspA family protein
VALWDFEDVRKLSKDGDDIDHLIKMELDRFIEKTRKSNIRVERSKRGEGVLQGLLAEAQKSDLLVLGTPVKGAITDNALAAAIWQDELSLLRKAECSILVVNQPFRPVGKVLVNYQGKIEGKAALRLAGEIAVRCSADVGVLSLSGDVAQSADHVATAGEYLKGFPLGSVELMNQGGDPESESAILSAADSWGADLIIIGEEPHGFLGNFFGQEPAEQMVQRAEFPILIAR